MSDYKPFIAEFSSLMFAVLCGEKKVVKRTGDKEKGWGRVDEEDWLPLVILFCNPEKKYSNSS